MVDVEKEDIRFNITKKALEVLAARGFVLPDKPVNEPPRMPQDITQLSNEELSRLLSSFSSWLGYATTRVALADVERTIAENQVEEKRTQNIEKMRIGDKRSVFTEIAARSEVHKEVLDAKKLKVELESVYKLTRGIADSYDRCVFACSRDQSRRENAMRAEGRSYSYGNGSNRTGEAW